MSFIHDERSMSTLQNKSQQWLAQAQQAFVRHPIELILATIAAITGTLLIGNSFTNDVAQKLAATFFPNVVLALIITYAISILHHFKVLDAKARWAMSGSFLMAVGAFATMAFEYKQESSWWTWGALVVAATLGFSLLPLARTSDPMARRRWFWNFNVLAVIQIALSAGFLLAMYLGLGLAFKAVNLLFNVHMPGRWMGYLGMWLGCFVFPWMIVSGSASLEKAGDLVDHGTRRLISIACHGLFLPLMLLYLAILYVYNIQILIDGLNQAPKNIMSPVILAAAGLQLASMFFGEQLRHGAKGAQSWFVRIIETLPALFIPLFPMAIWAVWIRVEQYGWTQFRYMRMLVLIILVVIFGMATVQKIRRRPQPLAAMAAIMASAMLLSTIGPWSAHDVTWRSQMMRLKQSMLKQGNIMTKSKNVFHLPIAKLQNKSVSYEDRQQLNLLCNKFGTEKLKPHFDALEHHHKPIKSCHELLTLTNFSNYKNTTKRHMQYVELDHRLKTPTEFQHSVIFASRKVWLGYDTTKHLADGFGAQLVYKQNTKTITLMVDKQPVAEASLESLEQHVQRCGLTCDKAKLLKQQAPTQLALITPAQRTVGYISLSRLHIRKREEQPLQLDNIRFSLILDRQVVSLD